MPRPELTLDQQETRYASEHVPCKASAHAEDPRPSVRPSLLFEASGERCKKKLGITPGRLDYNDGHARSVALVLSLPRL